MGNKVRVKNIIILLFASAILLSFGLYLNYYLEHRIRFNTMNLSEEQIMQYCPNYNLLIPSGENAFLSSDINSISFDDGDDTIYIILPKSADISNLICYVRDLNNNLFASRVILDLTQDVNFAGRNIKAIISNTPILYFSIDDSSLSYSDMILSNNKENTCSGSLIFDENVSNSTSDKRIHNISLSMRGAGYQFNTKKSLTLSFDKKTDLLDFGEHKKYNLLSNNYDPSLLKNLLFFKMAEEIGMDYVPKAANVTVFVDGDYQGVYTLMTKLSVGKSKIPLSPQDYLINFGGTNPQNIVFYESETYFCDSDIESPYFDVCFPYPLEDTTEIQSAVQNFISSVEDESDDTYLDYMDLDSMVKYYWIQEISMNFDACFRSTYATFNHEDAKIHMGPIWDMDLTLGSNFEKEGVMFNTPDGYRIRYMSWYPRLFNREEFSKAVKDEYINNDYRNILLSMSEYIKEQKEILSNDGEMNYRLYRNIELTNILQERTWTYEEFADSIIDFYDARIDWIDSNL